MARYLIQDLTSPDPLLSSEFNWNEYSVQYSFGRTHFASWYSGRYPFLSEPGFRALEERAVQFYKREYSDEWKEPCFSETLNRDVLNSMRSFHGNLQRVEQKSTRNFSATFAVMNRFVNKVSNLEEKIDVLTRSQAVLLKQLQSIPERSSPKTTAKDNSCASNSLADAVVNKTIDSLQEVSSIEPLKRRHVEGQPVDYKEIVMSKLKVQNHQNTITLDYVKHRVERHQAMELGWKVS